MRYLLQFLIPALILAGVVFVATRKRSLPVANNSDDTRMTVIAILVIGAVIAVASLFATQVLLGG